MTHTSSCGFLRPPAGRFVVGVEEWGSAGGRRPVCRWGGGVGVSGWTAGGVRYTLTSVNCVRAARMQGLRLAAVHGGHLLDPIRCCVEGKICGTLATLFCLVLIN